MILSRTSDRRCRRIALACGLGAALGALLTLAGWATDTPRLTDWLSDGISMLPNSAACTVCVGVALVLAAGRGRRRVVAALGILVALVGAATLLEYATRSTFGIDTLLVPRPWGQRATSEPGRMGAPSAISFMILGISLALLTGGRRRRQAAAVGALLAMAIAGLAFIGYVFRADVLYALPAVTAIARQTAGGVLLLGAGLLASAPECQPVATLLEESAAGALVRRALPFVVLLPIVAGWLRLRGQEAGLFDTAFGTALLVLTLIALLTVLLWWSANAVAAHDERLRESREHLRLITDHAPVSIAHCDTEARFKFVNAPYAERLGLRPEDVIGRRIPEVIGEAAYASFEHYVRQVLAGRAVDFEVEVPYRSGAQFMHCAYTPERDGEGRVVGFVAALSNVTDRRRAEQEVADGARRKDEFLATLAHELRNPLAPIRNTVELLGRADLDAAQLQSARGTLDRQSRQLVRLIDDLLDVGRFTRGKLELRRERVELAGIVEQAVEACRPLAHDARHELVVTLPPGPIVLHADAARLAQVFGNLLTNACKYTEPGGHVALDVRRDGLDVLVAVRDDGVGISPEMLPAVFELFTQVDRTLERSQGGLGIGLTLVKRLVEMHDGSVTARSDGPGRGSEFTVRLPMLVEDAEAGATVEQLVVDSGPAPSPLRILVVDDNLDSGDSLAQILRLRGHVTWMVHDGLAAVEFAEAHRPDVILLDIGMPKLNGYDACRAIRARDWGRDTTIIALTGWGQDDDRRKSAEAGFDEHLVKPVNHAELGRLLAAVGRKPPRESGVA
jgi:PAS domain S-box-containing protein